MQQGRLVELAQLGVVSDAVLAVGIGRWMGKVGFKWAGSWAGRCQLGGWMVGRGWRVVVWVWLVEGTS